MIEEMIKQIKEKFIEYIPWIIIALGVIILLPLFIRIFSRGFNFEILGIIIVGVACLSFGIFLIKNGQFIKKKD